MKIQKFHQITALNVGTTSATNLTTHTQAFDLFQATEFSIETKWGVHVHGTFTLEEKNAGSWRETTAPTFTKVTVTTGGQILDIIDAVSKQYKLKYVHQSGTTGPLQAWITIKNFS